MKFKIQLKLKESWQFSLHCNSFVLKSWVFFYPRFQSICLRVYVCVCAWHYIALEIAFETCAPIVNVNENSILTSCILSSSQHKKTRVLLTRRHKTKRRRKNATEKCWTRPKADRNFVVEFIVFCCAPDLSGVTIETVSTNIKAMQWCSIRIWMYDCLCKCTRDNWKIPTTITKTKWNCLGDGTETFCSRCFSSVTVLVSCNLSWKSKRVLLRLWIYTVEGLKWNRIPSTDASQY